MTRKNGTGGRVCAAALSAALVFAVAEVCSAPARTAQDDISYVVSVGTEIYVMTLPETDAGELALMCGHDPGEYIINVAEHQGYTAVTLIPAMDVSVTADGETRLVRATGGTVGELLEELGVALGAEDVVSAASDTPLEDGMEVSVSRVTYGEDFEEAVIPHGTVYESSSELYVGVEETVTQGSDGLERLTYQVKYLDGVETGRELVGRETVTEPVDTVIVQGTKEKEVPKPQPEPQPEPEPEPSGSGGQSSGGSYGAVAYTGGTVTDDGAGTLTTASGEAYGYSDCITMRATAYSYGAGSMTSSGAPVQVGIVAALPSVLPPGTRVYIVTVDGKYTYGPAVVGDTPGSNIIDLFYETEEECIRFGVRDAYVYILD